MVVAAGCDPAPPVRSNSTVAAAATTDTEHLSQVYSLLDQFQEVSTDRAVPELLFHLNQWGEHHRFPESWSADPLVERLPRSLRQFLTPEVLAQKTFDYPDLAHLQEALLLRDLAHWAVRRPADEPLEAWIRSADSGLSSEQADQLVLALRLFDWTVRNIQLDELLPYPKEDAAGPTGGENGTGAALELPAPLRALPGPGYQREPLQTLLLGHGDAIERARVFALLARQQQLDVVVLAVSDVKVASRPVPWVPAVMLGERLFLFDASLGLPLPGVNGVGIATLEQFRKNSAEMLAGLQIDEATKYGLRAEDLEHLVALIDASPLSLTLRMQELEPALVGEQQLDISNRPSQLGDRVRKLGGINGVGILPASWEAPLFRAAIGQMSRVNPAAAQRLLAGETLFQQGSPIALARNFHLRGKFESEDRSKGAKSLYVGARVPNQLLDELQTDSRAQRQLGIERDPGMSDTAWKNRLMAAEQLFREAKTHSTYWLGLVHFEGGDPTVAIEWLKTRTLDSGPIYWRNGARYNLARCYESLGRIKEARELYLEDDSPQRLGNRLRANQLRAR